MPDIKVNRDTSVVLQLSAHEAGRLMNVLFLHVGFSREPWANEVYAALDAAEIEEINEPEVKA